MVLESSNSVNNWELKIESNWKGFSTEFLPNPHSGKSEASLFLMYAFLILLFVICYLVDL